ncbi:unnamed protein product, partial [Ectocarpus sp. 4 AP-2014]
VYHRLLPLLCCCIDATVLLPKRSLGREKGCPPWADGGRMSAERGWRQGRGEVGDLVGVTIGHVPLLLGLRGYTYNKVVVCVHIIKRWGGWGGEGLYMYSGYDVLVRPENAWTRQEDAADCQ